jgi:biopolymer transport protein ExbB
MDWLFSGLATLSLPLSAVTQKSTLEILVWPGGGVIGLVLWALSVVMVALVIQAFLMVRRQNILPETTHAQIQALFEQKQYREAIELTAAQPDTLSHVVHAALSEAPRGYTAMEKAIEEATDLRTGKMLRSVEYLNLMGNVAPMLGLLGTVWGMIMAFFKIVEMGGNPNPADLADALGIKLVCTFVGLVIAIPSLTVYGIMRGKIDGYAVETSDMANSLIQGFRPGQK